MSLLWTDNPRYEHELDAGAVIANQHSRRDVRDFVPKEESNQMLKLGLILLVVLFGSALGQYLTRHPL